MRRDVFLPCELHTNPDPHSKIILQLPALSENSVEGVSMPWIASFSYKMLGLFAVRDFIASHFFHGTPFFFTATIMAFAKRHFAVTTFAP